MNTTGTLPSGEPRPDAYPPQEERTVVLADGRQVFLRPVVPGDLPELQRAIENADPETLRRRFLGGGPPRAEHQLRRLVDVDYHYRFALAAFDEQGAGVGIARYEGERTWPTVDVAVVVDPAWRSTGLGTELVRGVVARAVSQGASAVSADFYCDNLRVQQMLRDAKLPEQRHVDHGVVADVIDLRALNDLPGPRTAGDDEHCSSSR